MKIYNVKQIADLLNTKPETVRRWIRTGKLQGERTSRKEGNVVTEEDLKSFLKTQPKYAALATTLFAATAMGPLGMLAAPIVGGIAMSSNIKEKKLELTDNTNVSNKEIIKYLKDEVSRRTQSINQKLNTIEQMQREIINDQQQIAEYNLLLSQLEREDT